MVKIGSTAPQSQLPSLEERQMEFEWQQQMAREDQTFARKLAMEEREWAENMSERKAIREQKEEAARLSSLQEEQQEVAEEAAAQSDLVGADIDQVYSGSNMWASLVSGAGGGQSGAYSDFMYGGNE
tara:strand:+ start:108 stop:488 length:381 start_codon:yes stop_codon:yes gene_type:complete